MSDENLPPARKNKLDDKSAPGHSTDKDNGNASDNVHPANTNGIGQVPAFFKDIILGGCVGTGLWLLGDRLIAHGHKGVGGAISYLAFVTFLIPVPLTLLKFWPKPKIIWMAFAGFCVVLAIVFVYSSGTQVAEKPQLELAFLQNGDTVSPKAQPLELTNHFLFLRRGPFKTSDVRGILVVPLAEGSSNAVLTFAIINKSETPCDLADAQVESTTESPLVFSPGWVGTETASANMRGALIRCDVTILHNDVILLPEIKYLQITNRQSPLVIVRLRGKGFADSDFAFRVFFASLPPKPKKAFVTLGDVIWSGTNFGLSAPIPDVH